MDLPVRPPVKPMLAKAVKVLPKPPGLLYEPKWDGFRTIVFRDGDEVELGSRNERPMTRYFPEVVDAVRAQLPARCVIDGEIIVPVGDRLDFDALLQRIHPAASRVRKLAAETPARLVAFDLLALDDRSLMAAPFAERRAALVSALAGARPPVYVTQATEDFALAQRWFAQFEGAGLDGVVAKPLSATYRPDERVMFKVKHERSADCVVAGFRWHKSGPVVGSLLLGLYDDTGRLQHVGVAAAFSMARRRELVDELAPYRMDSLDGHPWAGWAAWTGSGEAGEAAGERMPGAQSRWNAGKDLSWLPLRPELVVEVAYDHMEGAQRSGAHGDGTHGGGTHADGAHGERAHWEGARFRHTAQFRRWRPDRDPRTCTYAQLEEPVRYDLAEVLAGPTPSNA